MHRALSIEEVLSTIFAFLSPDPRPAAEPGQYLSVTLEKRALLALATMNRIMSHIALDVLWAHPKTRNLAERMDPSLWTIASVDDYDGPLDDGMTESDYDRIDMLELIEGADDPPTVHPGDRFLHYARRVRALDLDCIDYELGERRVSSRVIRWWARLHSTMHIFPKLRALDAHAHAYDPLKIQTFLAFVTPKLVRLELTLPISTALMDDDTLSHVPAHLPCLDFLAVTIYLEVPAESLLTAMIKSAPNLRYINISGHISADHMLALSKLASLQTLITGQPLKEPYPALEQQLVGVFLQLETWWIYETSPTLLLLNFFLSATPNTRLEALMCDIHHEAVLPRSKFDALVDHIVQWTTLVDLHLGLLYFARTDALSTHDSRALLRKLHSLVRLQKLNIVLNMHISLDENSVCGVLYACPDLRDWQISVRLANLQSYSAPMSFSKFLGLLHSRPHTITLPISICCDVLPPLSSTSGVQFPLYRGLEVHAVQDSTELAKLVRSLLPHSSNIRSL